ncbi:MAG: oligosaccharide flippase family protein [Muribaculaceae bacterium]|nr:oligosaccharide flippase family protein [Muribaculaceae bacterium]
MAATGSKRDGMSRVILKAMGIFGGVQVLSILCSVIRTKLVALWIGPVGVGLFGLFNQALEMINTATNLGVRNSSVRDISQAVEHRDSSHIARVVTVVRRWSLWLGLGGALLTVAIAPALSRFTFGDFNHTWSFVALSLAVLFMALTNGEYAVLQGLAKLRRLARVTVSGTVGGLLISIPLFYFLREDSVLPSILAYALCVVVAAFVLKDKEYPKAEVSRRETVKMGAGFVKLGIYMTLGSFVAMIASYIFISWLNTTSGTHAVGFYQAGYTLIGKYAGLIFAALGMEFYPRLAKVAGSARRLRVFVSHEMNIAFMVLTPCLLAFILLRSQLVWLLYSKEFEVIITYISWGVVGTILRAASWCLAFVMLAKGDGKVYLITESLSAISSLGLNMLCFHLWGVDGLGYAYLAWYALYTIIVAVVYFGVYRLRLNFNCFTSLVVTLLVCTAMVVAVEHGAWIVAIPIFVVASSVSLFIAYRTWKR